MCAEPLADTAASCRVVVADADRRVRRDLAQLIELADGCAVAGVAGDRAAVLGLVRRLAPDVLVLDPRLPDIETGLALVAQVRAECPVRIVVLGHDPSIAPRALALGADEFVTKDALLSPLLDAIVGCGTRPSPGEREGPGDD